MSRRLSGDRGDATIETVLTVPVLILVIMTVVQFGLWYHASHTAQAAAQEGVRAARIEAGTADDGHRRAQAFMTSAAPTLVSDVVITVRRNADTAEVEVHGQVAAVVPFIRLPVAGHASGAVERFRPDG